MNKKIVIPLLLVLIVIGAGYWAWQQYGRAKNNSEVITASGIIEAQEVTVSAQIAGRIEEIKVEEGDDIKKGDIIARINDEVLVEQLKQAEAAYDIARVGVEKAKAGTLLEQELADAQLRQAEASLEIARKQLSYATIKSPLSGVVITKFVEAGELTSVGAPIAVIANLNKVDLSVYVDEDQLGYVKLGDKARISIDTYPDRRFQGRVSRIATRAEFTPSNIQTKEQRATTVYRVMIEIENRDGILKPGMPADAEIKKE